MSSGTPWKRLIVCVDSTDDGSEAKSATSKTTTILRLKAIISKGQCRNSQGQAVEQIVRYYRAAEDGPSLIERLKNKATIPYYEQQIKQIVRTICETLENSTDQLFLYGFGRGAFIVRAVAGVLHTLRLPKRQSMKNFDILYQSTLDVFKARHEDDNRNGPRILEFLSAHTTILPRIQFVGIFDTVKYTAEGAMHDISLVSSIANLRHALAINETRAQLNPEFIENPSPGELKDTTFVQAWFIGTHQDLLGSSYQDGLSLYPLQWMIIESMKCGLCVDFQSDQTESEGLENPLSLTFPQYAGSPPSLTETERVEWQIVYKNGIKVSLFDLQSVHGLQNTGKDQSHALQIGATNNFHNSPRRIFASRNFLGTGKSTYIDGLIGWNDSESYGTIIHPSVFCLLDRNPYYYEQSRFKALKADLGDCRERCLQDTEAELPPWLEGLELQASGVKAFRILVCGKTGVGKSSLINAVFGVEMTQESTTYQQGVHDIEEAFESPNHPGLLLHDSRGWQAGTDTELDLIAKFLRYRAYQKNPAESLHVIWFCVDADVSRIEEADRKTFATIAQYSNHVPVFVVGTKKDKLTAFRKVELLEKYMESTNDFQESKRLATEEAESGAEEQFMRLRDELAKVPHYKADGFVCLSKDDKPGIKRLLTQTLELISDERVRLFCVAAQVVDVEQKIDSAITECMRLSTHAVRTAMVPLPFSSVIGTPTVARILCEHMLLCFGFPKTIPDEVEDIMKRVLLGHMKKFMTVTFIEFTAISLVTAGVVVGTMGAGSAVSLALCVLAAPPTARMMFKCAADLILILERSFRYKGKYVSTKQIEDAAIYYTTAKFTTFSGKEKLLQAHVHDEIDRLIPLTKVTAGVRFSKLRTGFEEIIYKNRFEKPDGDSKEKVSSPSLPELQSREIVEVADTSRPAELQGDMKHVAELPAEVVLPLRATRQPTRQDTFASEMPLSAASSETPSWIHTPDSGMSQVTSERTISEDGFPTSTTLGSPVSPEEEIRSRPDDLSKKRTNSSLFSKGFKSMSGRKLSSKFGLSRTKTGDAEPLPEKQKS